MPTQRTRSSAFFILVIIGFVGFWLLSKPATACPQAATPDQTKDSSDDGVVTTSHDLRIKDRPLSYMAAAGTIPLLKEDGTVRANVFLWPIRCSGMPWPIVAAQ